MRGYSPLFWNIMQEPCEYLVYLYYKCPHCDSVSDEVRLSEAKVTRSLICPFCDKPYRIKPVKNVSIEYKDSTKKKTNKNSGLFKRVKKSLIGIGYSGNQAKTIIKRTELNHEVKDYSSFIKNCLIEAAKIYPSA